VHFDELNGGSALGGWCRADTFSDAFDSEADDAHPWARGYADYCTTEVTGGQLRMTPDGGAAPFGYCEHLTSAAYDLTDSSVRVEVAALPASDVGDFSASLYLVHDPEHTLFVGYENDAIRFGFTAGGSPQQYPTVPYEPSAHRFWRIREEQGAIFWEVSADGETWTVLESAAATLPEAQLRALAIELDAWWGNGVATPADVRFEQVNVPAATSRSR
jgi:hypothetical protein